MESVKRDLLLLDQELAGIKARSAAFALNAGKLAEPACHIQALPRPWAACPHTAALFAARLCYLGAAGKPEDLEEITPPAMRASTSDEDNHRQLGRKESRDCGLSFGLSAQLRASVWDQEYFIICIQACS